jgi:hypothetical protein
MPATAFVASMGVISAPALLVQIVNGLTDRMTNLSRRVLHIPHNAIRRTFIGHLLVAGEPSHAFLDRARDRSGLALCPAPGAPA